MRKQSAVQDKNQKIAQLQKQLEESNVRLRLLKNGSGLSYQSKAVAVNNRQDVALK